MQIENCEFCGERPGETNSKYYNLDESDLGGWVCIPCEQDFEQENEEDMRGGHFADMSNIVGVVPKP